jgi:hypothetical protein
MSWSSVLDSLATIGLVGWVVVAWVLFGRAARAAGLTRLELLGLAALAGWLLG